MDWSRWFCPPRSPHLTSLEYCWFRYKKRTVDKQIAPTRRDNNIAVDIKENIVTIERVQDISRRRRRNYWKQTTVINKINEN